MVANLPLSRPPNDMRRHPIGTGLFKFVEFKPNEVIRVTRNPDYRKKDRRNSVLWSMCSIQACRREC